MSIKAIRAFNDILPGEMDYESKSIKSQMRRADKLGARFAAVIGDSVLERGSVNVKDMSRHTDIQTSLELFEDAFAGSLLI